MPQTRHNSDLLWMQRALNLGDRMRGHVWPNPPVGCVIVRDGKIVAEAATHPGGRPHAERKAIELAGFGAKGATLYVTLEPCCHWGKTPPCADAIIEAGLSRVVCAVQDPDPRVHGGGFAKLRGAGIEVQVGLCAEEAERLMSGFFHRVRLGEPELFALEQPTKEVPIGIDALLRSSRETVHLVTRRKLPSADLDLSAYPKARLLSHLAEMGLTSVAIARDDPLADRLIQRASEPANIYQN